MGRNASLLSWLMLVSVFAADLVTGWTSEELCEACKDMSSAFKKGLQASQRSNFGGGNTAWEESRLGAWAFSETRLVGILEGVCKDAGKSSTCHSLVEEHEEAIEEWWRKKYRADPKKASLFKSLCVNRLKVCCPALHYGDKCVPCPGIIKTTLSNGTVEEKACSGHGECTGAGHRSGKGTCKCDEAYDGDQCNMCADNFFNANDSKDGKGINCEACHEACDGGCTGLGPELCTAGCKNGWRWTENGNGCEDIDECANVTHPVCTAAREFCENTPGSYSCPTCDSACERCVGPTSSNCTACAPGYRFSAEPNVTDGQGHCEDVNECLQGICGEGKVCNNLPGSHSCSCPEGQEENAEGQCVTKASSNESTEEEPDDTKEEEESNKHDEL